MIEPAFINKYKSQYYSSATSIDFLKAQQSQLVDVLNNLNEKLSKEVQKKQYVKSNRQTINHSLQNTHLGSRTRRNSKARDSKGENDKENKTLKYNKLNSLRSQNNKGFLPSLVIDAQLKNSQNYSMILRAQKSKLDKRIKEHQNHKTNQLVDQLKQNHIKLESIRKNNKGILLQIQRNGEEINNDQKNNKAIYQELMEQLSKKRNANEKKKNKIEEVAHKIYKLEQDTMSLNLQIGEEQRKIPEKQEGGNGKIILNHQNTQAMVKKLRVLVQKKEKLTINLHSIQKRLQQDYFLKLKELSNQNQRNNQLHQKCDIISKQTQKLQEQIKAQKKQKNKKIQQSKSKEVKKLEIDRKGIDVGV